MEVLETLVCNRWKLPLLPGLGGHYAYLETASKKNEECFMHLTRDFPTNGELSVVEYFGGVGIFSTIIQQRFQPWEHYIYDIDPDCVRQLESAFAGVEGVHVAQGDAKQTMGERQCDMVVLDFAIHNFRTHEEWPFERVTDAKPQYLVWSDTALRRLGLHRALYTKAMDQWLEGGKTIHSFEDYVMAYSRFIWRKYHYCITRVSHHVYSYFLAESVPYRKPEIVKVC
jgi:hypothetical protein